MLQIDSNMTYDKKKEMYEKIMKEVLELNTDLIEKI